jgi:hypothetical protein
VAQPSLARPSSARAPLAPRALPMRAPSPGLFLSFDFSRTATSLSLHVVVPQVLETVIAGFGPRGELPSPASSPRGLPVCAPSALRARSQPRPWPRPPRRLTCPGRAPPLGSRAVPAAPRALPARALTHPCPRSRPCPGGPRAPCACTARVPPARATVVARHSNLSLINFNFSLVNVLRRALCRATIHFKFIFINVLHHAPRRTTIQFKFIFVNDLCRTLRRATVRFKFSSVDARRRALRHATPNVSL